MLYFGGSVAGVPGSAVAGAAGSVAGGVAGSVAGGVAGSVAGGVVAAGAGSVAAGVVAAGGVASGVAAGVVAGVLGSAGVVAAGVVAAGVLGRFRLDRSSAGNVELFSLDSVVPLLAPAPGTELPLAAGRSLLPVCGRARLRNMKTAVAQSKIQAVATPMVIRVNRSPAFVPKALWPPGPPRAPVSPPPRPRCTSTRRTRNEDNTKIVKPKKYCAIAPINISTSLGNRAIL